MAMKTTDKVPKLALYASDCCGDEVVFDVREHFCRCPKCNQLCRWELVERVFSWQEMEELEPYAA
jgi:hypothetical protein